MKAKYLIITLVVTTLFSCVSPRIVDDLKSKISDIEGQNAELKAENEKLSTENNECKSKLTTTQKELSLLAEDTTITGSAFRRMKRLYNDINIKNDELIAKLEKLQYNNEQEAAEMSEELLKTRQDLLAKEDKLKALEKDLNIKKENLDILQADLDKSKKELEAKLIRINELESILNRKDSIVQALKNKVSDALLGFENNGLTIEQKNGKVYVSLDEQLLFASGSSKVDPKGQEALKKLASVLAKNKEINILIEGHTDSDEYRGSGQIKDNWDLSVIRATAIVKILMQNKEINPQRLVASGRSQYVPLDESDTKEAKKKNRRTEIILTPNLDELFELLEN